MSEAMYEVYAIKYGERIGKRGEIFAGGDPHEAPLAMDYFVWAIRNKSQTIVVDVGFGEQEGARRGRDYLRSPIEGLKLIGVQAEEVRDVIITHMHYDHVGNLELFPNARFHIQDSELEYVTGRAMTHRVLRRSYTLNDVIAMVKLVYSDRVIFHNCTENIADGITVHPIGGHSRGLQCVTVQTQRGQIVLASDASHYYESIEREIPFGVHEDMFKMLEGYRKVRTLAPRISHIIPGHDPEVMKRYPSPSKALKGIVVRLDLEPSITPS